MVAPVPEWDLRFSKRAQKDKVRITYTHRLVYEVDRKARIVKILAMWTHYE